MTLSQVDRHSPDARRPTKCPALRSKCVASATWPPRFPSRDPDQPRRVVCAARLADRPRAPARPLPAARAGDRAVAGRPGTTWSRRRTTRRCSRSATRSGPGSTSSPTARRAARATRTASRPRSPASTSTTRARRSTAAATRIRCRASSARSSACTRCRCATSQFLRANTSRPIKITVPGPFTMSQQAQNDHYESEAELALGVRRRRARRDRRPVRGRRRHRADRRALHAGAAREGARVRRWPRSSGRSTASVGTTAVHICFGYAAIIHERPSAYSFLPELAAVLVRPDLDRDGAVGPRHVDPRDAARQADHPRRDRPRRHRRSSRPRPSPTASAARCPTSARPSWSPRRTAA